MKALLDTHVFLWWITDDTQLPTYIREIVSNSDNGKIKLPDKPDRFISDQLAINTIQTLPIQASHALYVFNLPPLPRDPFDRIIVSQAQLEKLPVITSDPLIKRYKINTIWKRNVTTE
jgi:PIN domain nuclease of toxin-antitoxin system